MAARLRCLPGQQIYGGDDLGPGPPKIECVAQALRAFDTGRHPAMI
jgi:hypothetical protein